MACVGECMVELQERPDGLLRRSFGGDTLNTAVYLARLGVKVDYITALGTDGLSDEMLLAWQREGVGTTQVRRHPGQLPGLYFIQTDLAGERHFLYWRDSAAARQLFNGVDLIDLAAYRVVYLSGITLSIYRGDALTRLFKALERARDFGAIIAFDMNFRARGWPDAAVAATTYRQAMSLSDIIFASVADLSGVFGANGEFELNHLSRHVERVIKLDRPACRIMHDGVEVTCEAVPAATVLDTTAAGDSFAAAYLAHRLIGAAPLAAALAGHALAAIVVAHPGAIVPRSATEKVTAGTSQANSIHTLPRVTGAPGRSPHL